MYSARLILIGRLCSCKFEWAITRSRSKESSTYTGQSALDRTDPHKCWPDFLEGLFQCENLLIHFSPPCPPLSPPVPLGPGWGSSGWSDWIRGISTSRVSLRRESDEPRRLSSASESWTLPESGTSWRKSIPFFVVENLRFYFLYFISFLPGAS